jgi:hypothetical protein
MSSIPTIDPAELARENEQLKQLLAQKEQELETARGWFQAFQRIDSWLLEQGLWDREDIHESDPAQTVITGLSRNLTLRDAQALQHCKNLLAGLVDCGELAMSSEADIEQLLKSVRVLSLQAPSESQAKVFVAFAQARRAYARWLSSTPPETYAPATHDEVMALYDQTSSPALPCSPTAGPLTAALQPEVVYEVVKQCQTVVRELAAREDRSANVDGKLLLQEAANELVKVSG